MSKRKSSSCDREAVPATMSRDKEVLPVGSTRCLKGVFDALTQFGVDTAPRPVRCNAFAHSSGLDLTFSLHPIAHPKVGIGTTVTTSFKGNHETHTKTMRAAVSITVCNEKSVLDEIKAGFGGINSRGLVGLSSEDVKMNIKFKCSESDREMANNMDGSDTDGSNYTYVAYPSTITVELRFLSSLGWIKMEGEIPVWARHKELEAAFHKGNKFIKFEEKLGVNWLRFNFSSEEQNFPLSKASVNRDV
jgi:hypothetical protein